MPLLLALADTNAGPLLGRSFAGWGEDAKLIADGQTACTELLARDGPRLAVIDCDLPEEGGLEVCRKLRAAAPLERPYLILLGLSRSCPDVPAALASGADDYIPFPVALDELMARVEVGKRTLAHQAQLLLRCTAMGIPPRANSPGSPRELRTLCAYCKSVRTGNRWHSIEELLTALGQECTHTICPTCYDARVRPELAALAGEAG
jgi:DNA-binding response OmpR family regulator